jgi:DUF4097 and DUF4098 domain-containing protein YvlB
MSNGIVSRQRSFAGPIVLILIGVVFLLRNLHLVGWDLGDLFAKYWPLLLILWGVIKLVEYQQAKSAGLAPAGIGVGGVFLIIFLVTFGLSAHRYKVARDSGVFSNMDCSDMPDPFNFICGQSFTFDDQLEQAFVPGSTLRIINEHGNINVNAADGDRIKVIVRKTIRADNQVGADNYNRQTKPQLTVVERTVTLNANTEGAGGHDVSADLDVYVPRKVAITISSRRGDVSVMAREGDIEASSQNGEVSLQDVTGNAKLDIEKSNVRIARLTGDVSIEGKVNQSEVNISDVKGTVRLTGEFHENVSLARISGMVTFKSARTDLELSKLDGNLDLDGGDLHGSSVAGPVRLLTREKDIRLDGVTGDVRVNNNDGAVEIKITKLPVGNIDINNRNADVALYLPEKAGFKLDANTDNGEVQSGYSELKVNNNDDRGQASGTVGSGAGHIRITNAHGGIEIRKGTTSLAGLKPPSPPKAPGSEDDSSDDDSDKPKEGVREF